MERRPHKSSWKERKRRDDEIQESQEKAPVESDLRESLSKIKKYTMILCIVLAIGALGAILDPTGIIFTLSPILGVVGIFIAVFMIYFPLSDLLKNPETR